MFRCWDLEGTDDDVNNYIKNRFKDCVNELEGTDRKYDRSLDGILDKLLTDSNNGNVNIITDRMVIMIEALKI